MINIADNKEKIWCATCIHFNNILKDRVCKFVKFVTNDNDVEVIDVDTNTKVTRCKYYIKDTGEQIVTVRHIK